MPASNSDPWPTWEMNVRLPLLKPSATVPTLVNWVGLLPVPGDSVTVPYDWKFDAFTRLCSPTVTEPNPSLVNPLKFTVALEPAEFTPGATAKVLLLSKC